MVADPTLPLAFYAEVRLGSAAAGWACYACTAPAETMAVRVMHALSSPIPPAPAACTPVPMFARLPAITRSQEYYADRRPELLPNLVAHLGEGQEAVVQVGAVFVLPLTTSVPAVT